MQISWSLTTLPNFLTRLVDWLGSDLLKKVRSKHEKEMSRKLSRRDFFRHRNLSRATLRHPVNPNSVCQLKMTWKRLHAKWKTIKNLSVIALLRLSQSWGFCGENKALSFRNERNFYLVSMLNYDINWFSLKTSIKVGEKFMNSTKCISNEIYLTSLTLWKHQLRGQMFSVRKFVKCYQLLCWTSKLW